MADAFATYLANNPGTGDAWAYLDSLLGDLGLSDLNDFVKEQIVQGRSNNEIIQRLREQPSYKVRFKANEQRKALGLPPLAEADIISYENQARQLLRSAGLPSGFYDSPDDFASLLAGDVSVSELNTRINDGYVAASMAPPEVRAQLQDYFGIGVNDLAAYYLDPDRALPILQTQLATAQVGAQALRTGFGHLGVDEAKGLVSQGVSDADAQRGFTELAGAQELMTSLPGLENSEDTISKQEQLGATFSGNAQAKERIRKRAAQRTATFQGSAAFAQSKGGNSGLGTAR